MSEWAPELVVDEARARRLIESQFPELDSARLELFGQGWDMTVWRVGGDHVFRFPRREVVVPGLLRELEVLPRIARQLPLRVPEPRFVGRPDGDYPWPFYGAPLIPGQEVGQAGLDQAERDALAPALGGFLRTLHALPPPDLPHDINRRADMPFRAERVRDSLARLAAAALWTAPAQVEQILSRALALGSSYDHVLTHGDLHLRHLLVDAGAADATGVIDWIDVCLAPRGIDLVLYWSLFSPTGRSDFQSAYGDLDKASLLQGRVLALHLCAVLADYAHTTGAAWLRQEALAGLERTLVD